MDNEIKIKKLLSAYRNIVIELQKLGAIKTGSVVPQIGELAASKKLKLDREKNPSHKGFDATDNEGRRYQIKTRKATPWNPKGHKFPSSKKPFHFDFLVMIEFDENWNIIGLLKIPASQVDEERHTIRTKKLQKYNVL